MAAFSGWEAALLRAIKAPVTKANIAFLDAWQKTEGGTASYNPLNATQLAPGATVLAGNSSGVKNYTSAAEGITATAQELLGLKNSGAKGTDYYPTIVAALRSGNATSWTDKFGLGDVMSELDTWGSTGFAKDLASGVAGGGGVSGVVDAAGSALKSAEGEAAGTAESAASDLSPASWLKSVEGWLTKEGKLVLAYVLLIGVAGGLFLTGLKGLGVPVPKAPAVVPV